MRQRIRTLAVVGLSLGLMAFFLRSANLGRVWEAVILAQWDLVGGAFVLMVASHVVRIIRWRYLLRPLGPVRFMIALRATVIGFAVSALLPGRLGELARPYLLARRERLSASAAFATVVLERILDLLAVVLIFGVCVVGFDPHMAVADTRLAVAVRSGAGVVGLGGLLALVGICVVANRSDLVGPLVSVVRRVLPARFALKLSAAVVRFVEGLAAARQVSGLLVAVAWSLVLWLASAASFWFVSLAFGIEVPAAGAATLLTLGVVGVAVPTPAGIGGFHAAYQAGAMELFGASFDAAVGAALVLHAIAFSPVTVLGILFMAQEGIRFGDLDRFVRDLRKDRPE